MANRMYYIVNGITLYRLIMVPVLFVLVITGNPALFKWLLPWSFFSDLADGYLARKYKVYNEAGARLDSIADDLTIAVSIVALFVFKEDLIASHLIMFFILSGLWLVQMVLAFMRYGRITSFHTYLAKIAALLQGVFLILVFIFDNSLDPLLYAMVVVTIADLIEEILLVLILPTRRTNVKGLYWHWKKHKKIGLR